MLLTKCLPSRSACLLLLMCGVWGISHAGITEAELPIAGINGSGLSYYTTAWPFANLLYSQAEWTENVGNVELDADGYPKSVGAGQKVSTWKIWTHNESAVPGKYVLSWDGDGDVSWEGGTVVSESSNRIEYNLTNVSWHGHTLTISRSNANDPVKNIRLWMPGTEHTGSIFHPIYKERLKAFDGPIRFMTWFNTNYSPLVHWSQRTRPTHVFQAGKTGIAYEFAIRLCNEVQRDMWLCIPHAATDDFVRTFAQLVKDSLDSNLKAWIEYSNETWGFSAHVEYVQSLADQWGISHSAAHGRRSVQIFDIFEDVFGGTERLVRVVAGRSSDRNRLGGALSEVKRLSGDGPLKADVASIAYYWTGHVGNLIHKYRHGDLTPIFEVIRDSIEQNEVTNWKLNMMVAKRFGIPMVGYEANQHLRIDGAVEGYDDATVVAAAKFCRDPRIVDLYKWVLDKQDSLGMKMPAFFVLCSRWSKYGQWGHLEYMNQPVEQAPLYKAVTEWIDWKRQDRTGARSPDGAPLTVLPQPTRRAVRAYDLKGRIGETLSEKGMPNHATGSYILRLPDKARTIVNVDE